MPLLPLLRSPVPKEGKGAKEAKPIDYKSVSYALYVLLAEVPKSLKMHQLFARLLQWGHGFDPEHRDIVDQVLAAFMSDYDHAMIKHADAFQVARKMLQYQLEISDDGEAMIKRDGELEKVVIAHPYKSAKKPASSDKSEKKSEKPKRA